MFIGKNLPVSGPSWFRPVLSKGQLYCYKVSILLLVVVNLLLCLMYKLSVP